MEKLEVTWGNALLVWWSFVWRATVFGAVAGFVAGAALGVVAALTGHADSAELWGGIAGYIVALPISLWCMKIILSKSYENFEVALIARNEAAEEETSA